MPPTTRLSTKGFFERQAVDVLRTDQPMDSGGVWTLIDNVAHMVDECGKYRVNWIGDVPGSGTHYGIPVPNSVGSDEGVWHATFPGQAILDSQYPRYDIRVAIIANSDPHTVRVSLVTLGTQPPVVSASQSGVIGTFTQATVEGVQWIEGLIVAGPTSSAPFYTQQPPTYPESAAFVAAHLMLRLLVEMPTGEASVVLGCQVREYLR